MVKNLWKQIVLVCGNCEEHPVLQLIDGPSSPFYACPRYYPENREPNTKACPNRINLVDYEKMVDYFSDRIEESICNGSKENLKNVRWVYKNTIEFVVLEHTENVLRISMRNKKAFK